MSWKLATFNVNGIRARLPLVLDWLETTRPDVLCMQETKCQDKDFPADAFAEIGYQVQFHGQKSFNGVAIASLAPAGRVVRGIPGHDDEQARVIAAELGGVWVVNTYVPQGRDVADPAFAYKLEFLDRLHDWFRDRCDPAGRMIWCGDINVAPEDRDVYDPEAMAGKVTCHPDERAAVARLTGWGLRDLFRGLHPDQVQYTFWDYRLRGGFKRNLGWRIDMIMATAPLAALCTGCTVDTAPRGLEKPSDHTPVVAEFDL